jgi:protein involved in polysaccharide export with SLBB domain
MRTHYHPRDDSSSSGSASKRVCLFGFARRQGACDFPSTGDLTVSGLLQRADGVTSKKKVPKIVIVRLTPQGHKRILVNTKALLIEKKSEYDLFLRPDDVVIVE